MYRSMIHAAIDNLERELEYYKEQSREKTEIIEQLHRGYALPGKVVYIHPYDFMELMNNLDQSDVILYRYDGLTKPNEFRPIKGIVYKPTPNMPQITKNFK